MDANLMELLRDRFDKLDAELSRMNDALQSHTAMDALYWKKIDANEAQLSLVKWLGSGLSGSALLAWLYNKFGGHP